MERLEGYVSHIIYRNAENGYTVFDLQGEEETTCVGSFPALDEGETLELFGDFTEHAVYGHQFKVTLWQTVSPEDALGMERYLGSGAVRGVGAALAARIVKRFGRDTFRIIEEEPERLAEVRGISERKAMEIAVQMEEKRDMRQAMVYLQKYGISNTLAVKIYETYQDRLYRVLEENPYQLADDIEGIGFKKADELASRLGILMDSEYRIRSGILYTLQQAAGEGHIFLPKTVLVRRSAALLELEEKAVEEQIANLIMDRRIVAIKEKDNVNCYVSSFYYAELSCARMLLELYAGTQQVGGEGAFSDGEGEKALLDRIEKLQEEEGIELDALQKKAVLESIRNHLLILTGGPGTGKTTTINMMIRYFISQGLDLFLAAPTGRAARRMTEATGYEARTIHRMLELSGAAPEENRKASFLRNADNPLEADVIIVDEMSMVDIYLFQALLKAVSPGTRLILVGDDNQLPSVGPGQVLHDLIASQAFPVVCLQKIFRQAGESDIVVNAHRINRGEPIGLDNKSRDFFFLERSSIPVIYKHMIQLIREKLPPYVQADPYDIQVLTPMRRGALGVETLNGILQAYLNPPTPSRKEIQIGETLFREGDKVMQTRNDYQLEWEVVSRYGIPIERGVGIFNGDTGTIKEIDAGSQTVTVEYDEGRRVTYGFSQMEEIELAYAVTIHKAQGSEYPAVIMPLLGGPKLLMNRNLLYTGVTRARDCVTILGSRQVVEEMIANVSEAKRYSSLDKRIRELKGEFCSH